MSRQFLLIPLFAIALLTALSFTLGAYQPGWAASSAQSQPAGKPTKSQDGSHRNARNHAGSPQWSRTHALTNTHALSDTTALSSTQTISDVTAYHADRDDESGHGRHAAHGRHANHGHHADHTDRHGNHRSGGDRQHRSDKDKTK